MRKESENGGADPPPTPQDSPPNNRKIPSERALSLALTHPKRVLGIGLAPWQLWLGPGHPDRDRFRHPLPPPPRAPPPSKTSTPSSPPPASPASSNIWRHRGPRPDGPGHDGLKYLSSKQRVLEDNGFSGENPPVLNASIYYQHI